jgi:hypothetical protein
MVMSRDQNVERSHNIKTDNSSFERVEQFRYLGTTLPNQNSTHEENKGRLQPENAGCHKEQEVLSSILLSKNIKIKIYRIIIFACCFAWV